MLKILTNKGAKFAKKKILLRVQNVLSGWVQNLKKQTHFRGASTVTKMYAEYPPQAYVQPTVTVR